MISHPRRRAATAFLTIALVALAACSSDGDSSTTASASTAEATSSTEVAPTTSSTSTSSTAAGTSTSPAPTTTSTMATTTTVVSPAAVEPLASAGCSAVSPMRLPVGDTTLPVTAADAVEAGSMIVHVPVVGAGPDPMPLILDLHGYSEPASIHVVQSGLAGYGDQQGFVTAAPFIEREVPRWDTNLVGPDVTFVVAALDQLEASLCLDRNRVFVAGLSNGAFMASTLACSLADRIAAVATVAGIQAPPDCEPARPVPVVAFHGTADRFVPYEGGLGPAVADLPSADGSGTLGSAAAAQTGPSVPDRAATWAARNGCSGEPVETAVAADVGLLSYPCPPGDEVELYRIAEGGHTWPGSEFSRSIEAIVGLTTFSISANEILWTFFVDHPLRP